MGDLQHEHARQTEICLFYNGAKHFFPEKRPQDVIYAAKTENYFHPTEKPVSLMQQAAKWTHGVITDPFMGSGSTGVACVKEGRKFIGIEKDEEYFNIGCKRIEDAYRQADIFIEQPKPKMQQQSIDL